jgi:hypothetical protein
MADLIAECGFHLSEMADLSTALRAFVRLFTVSLIDYSFPPKIQQTQLLVTPRILWYA